MDHLWEKHMIIVDKTQVFTFILLKYNLVQLKDVSLIIKLGFRNKHHVVDIRSKNEILVHKPYILIYFFTILS